MPKDVFTFRVYPVDPDVTIDQAIEEDRIIRVEGEAYSLLALITAGQEALGLERVDTEQLH